MGVICRSSYHSLYVNRKPGVFLIVKTENNSRLEGFKYILQIGPSIITMVNLPTIRRLQKLFFSASTKMLIQFQLDWLSLSKLKLPGKFLDDKMEFFCKSNLDKNLSHSLKNAGR